MALVEIEENLFGNQRSKSLTSLKKSLNLTTKNNNHYENPSSNQKRQMKEIKDNNYTLGTTAVSSVINSFKSSEQKSNRGKIKKMTTFILDPNAKNSLLEKIIENESQVSKIKEYIYEKYGKIFSTISEYLNNTIEDNPKNDTVNIVKKQIEKIYYYTSNLLSEGGLNDIDTIEENIKLHKQIENYKNQINKYDEKIKILDKKIMSISKENKRLKSITENMLDFEKKVYDSSINSDVNNLIHNAKREISECKNNFKMKEMEYLCRIGDQNEKISEYERQIYDLNIEKINNSKKSVLFPNVKSRKVTKLIKYCPKKDREEAKERALVKIPTHKDKKIKGFNIKIDSLEDNSQEYLYTAILRGRFNKTIKYNDLSLKKKPIGFGFNSNVNYNSNIRYNGNIIDTTIN